MIEGAYYHPEFDKLYVLTNSSWGDILQDDTGGGFFINEVWLSSFVYIGEL